MFLGEARRPERFNVRSVPEHIDAVLVKGHSVAAVHEAVKGFRAQKLRRVTLVDHAVAEVVW